MFIRRSKENKISKLNSLETKIQEMSEAHIVTFKRLKEENERLARTIKNHIPKEIAYQNYPSYYSLGCEKGCYIYKDGSEYAIRNLHLYNPKFHVSEVDSVITIKDWRNFKPIDSDHDKFESYEYVVDLFNRSFIKVK